MQQLLKTDTVMRKTRRGMIDKILSTHLYYLIMAENSSDISKKIEKVM
jgi:hypothetical protein